MSSHSTALKRQPSRPLIPSKVFGMLIFVYTEIMFFVALISSYLVIKGDGTSWSVPVHIKLPVMATSYNTMVLMVSGVLLFLAGSKLKVANDQAGCRSLLGWSAVLGGFFVLFQGYEWFQLISYGMTMKSGIFAACFFLLTVCHGLHALMGVFGLIYVYRLTELELDSVRAIQIFWYFVVGIWPVLYYLVYFGG